MLRPLCQYRTNCCGHFDEWQFSLVSRAPIHCHYCKAVGQFASLPCEIQPPAAVNAHAPRLPEACPARVAFIPSNQEKGFLFYSIGDELHCGVVDTTGCVKSYLPKEGSFRCDRSKVWKQAIVCEFTETGCTDGAVWDKVIEDEIRKGPKSSQFDCLDFAVGVLNRAAGSNLFTREVVSERMGQQLYHLMKYAEIQRDVMNL